MKSWTILIGYQKMIEVKAFLSYVHQDDDAEGARITQLGQDIAEQYAMATGEKIHLFIDKDRAEGISWGEEWREVIDNSIAAVAFFIPIMTTRYFQSAECRRELQLFLTKAEQLGIQELVLPIYYYDIAGFSADETGDDLKDTLKKYQYIDWRDLKFESRESGAYRRAVHDLAQRLVKANAALDESPDQMSITESTADNVVLSDDAPGTLDSIEDIPQTVPLMAAAMEGIGVEMVDITKIFNEALPRLNKKGAPLSQKMKLITQMAHDVQPHADKIDQFGQQYTKNLYRADVSVGVLTKSIADRIREKSATDEEVTSALTYARSVEGLDQVADENLEQIKNLLNNFEPLERASRDIRKPLKTIRKGLTSIIEGREIIAAWSEGAREIRKLAKTNEDKPKRT